MRRAFDKMLVVQAPNPAPSDSHKAIVQVSEVFGRPPAARTTMR